MPYTDTNGEKFRNRKAKREASRENFVADVERQPVQIETGWKEADYLVAPASLDETPFKPKAHQGLPDKNELKNSEIEKEKKGREEAAAWANDPFSKQPEKTPEELLNERVEKNLEGWPWERVPKHLVTLSPFAVNNYHDGGPFTLPKAEQTSSLLKLLENEYICETIMRFISMKHSDATNFALTSRRSLDLFTSTLDFWDFTGKWYGNCEIPRDEPGADPFRAGKVASMVVVSPIRSPFYNAKDPASLESQSLYRNQVDSLHKLCLSMFNFADFFRNLQLHRIAFLTTDILALFVPGMRNLKVLGVYNCQLIHISDTMKLLEIIKTDKPLERENQVYLDFFPRFHAGPVDPLRCTGSYGVTWDNWNGGDTRLAVWALVQRIILQAHKQGIEIEQEGTMFRKWLDKSPCWRVKETLEWFSKPLPPPGPKQEIFLEHLVATLDFPHYSGSRDNLIRKRLNEPEGYQWKTKRYVCNYCKSDHLGVFYFYDSIRRARNEGSLRLPPVPSGVVCLGCTLSRDLDEEEDHYKVYKRMLIHRWLKDGDEWNITDARKAFEDFKLKKIGLKIKKLDRDRINDINSENPQKGYDREFDERHRAFNRAQKGKIPTTISPSVYDKDRGSCQWNRIDKSRLYAHGH